MVWIMHATTRMFGDPKAIGHAATLWAHAGRTQRLAVSAAIRTIFVQNSADAARARWRSVAGQLRGKFAKLGALMDDVEAFSPTARRSHESSAPCCEQNEGRYLQLEGLQTLNDAGPTRLPAVAHRVPRVSAPQVL